MPRVASPPVIDPFATLEAFELTLRHLQQSREAVRKLRRPAAAEAGAAVGETLNAIGIGLQEFLQAVVDPIWTELPEPLRERCRAGGVKGRD